MFLSVRALFASSAAAVAGGRAQIQHPQWSHNIKSSCFAMTHHPTTTTTTMKMTAAAHHHQQQQQRSFSSSQPSVAVLGAGPSGLVTLKTLRERGMDAVCLEREADIGGLWNLGSDASCIWNDMHMNGYKLLSAASDYFFDPSVPDIPTAQHYQDYLQGYVEHFDLKPHIRFHHKIVRVSKRNAGEGYTVVAAIPNQAGEKQDEIILQEYAFDKVVVCTSRMSPFAPHMPNLPGTFPREHVQHSSTYKGTAPWAHYQDKRVLVVGGKVSGAETAASLVRHGVQKVVLSTRVKKYFYVPKNPFPNKEEEPTEPQIFNKLTLLALQCATSKKQVSDYVEKVLVDNCGHPEHDWNVWSVNDDFYKVSTMSSQGFPELVRDGQIQVQPGIQDTDGHVVTFTNGISEYFDKVIMATGFDHACAAFLDDEIQQIIGCDKQKPWLSLYKSLIHPDLPGMAFVGSAFLMGSLLPGLEMDAMCTALLFNDELNDNLPSEEEMRREIAAVDAARSDPNNDSYATFHELVCQRCETLARWIGVNPIVARHPTSLTKALTLGPVIAAQFRLDGPFALQDRKIAEQRYLEQLVQVPHAREEYLNKDGTLTEKQRQVLAQCMENGNGEEKAFTWEPALQSLLAADTKEEEEDAGNKNKKGVPDNDERRSSLTVAPIQN